MSLKFCPQCGKNTPSGIRFCPHCGFNISQFSIQNEEVPSSNDNESLRNTKEMIEPMLDEGFNAKKAPLSKPIDRSSTSQVENEKKAQKRPRKPIPRKAEKNISSKNDSMPDINKNNKKPPTVEKSLIDYSLDNFLEDAPSNEKSKRVSPRRGNASNARKKTTITQAVTNVASKKLITNDTKYHGRKKVYIIEQEQLVDPDDPTYDCYYENVIPIDQVESSTTEDSGRERKSLSKEAKQTMLIIAGLLILMVVVIVKEFV